jgi:deaminated glutathione amidase
MAHNLSQAQVLIRKAVSAGAKVLQQPSIPPPITTPNLTQAP